MTQSAIQILDKKYNKLVGAASSNLCVHCGWCAESCHVYLATGKKEMTPVGKAEKVRRVYKKHHDWMSKIFPFWTGAKELSEDELDKWAETAFRDCTLCERCVVNCPMGVETPQIMAAARSTLTATGKAPAILCMLADSALAREENLDMFREMFVEEMKNLEKQAQDLLGSSSASIPVEKKGSRVLYVPLSGTHTIMPQAVLFNAVGESWTLSMFEAANYAMFLGDSERARRIIERIVREAEALGVEEVVLAECGHAYTTLRWEAPKILGKALPFRVRSILEVLDDYVQSGRLNLGKPMSTTAVTFHDPCNLGRKGGLFEEPRRLVKAGTEDFREMTPNRLQSFCCGGGAGLTVAPDWEEDRMKYGKPKADQIRKTGASVVVTSCDNCRHQITGLNEYYDLNVDIIGVSDVVANQLLGREITRPVESEEAAVA